MSNGIDGTTGFQRSVLLRRNQLPVAASVLMLLVLVAVFQLHVTSAPWLIAGLSVIGVATVLAAVLPWNRLRPGARALLPVLDLAGIAAIAMALHHTVDTVSVLTAFPAVWLGAGFGMRGVVAGVVGAYAAALAPLAAEPQSHPSDQWATALVVPVVVSVLVVVAFMTAQAARSTLAARDAAVAEWERFDAVMKSLFDELDLGLVFLDEQGRPVLSNQAILGFANLAGRSAADGPGTRVYAADQVTRLSSEEQPLERLKRGESFDDLLHWVGPRGGQRALLANGRTARRADGRIAGRILIVQDVTDFLRADRAREDALATLAHELRTPLTSIVGYTELLETEPLSETASARLEVVSRNADHLLTLVSRFLDGLHREVEVQRERMALRTLVDEAAAVLRATPGFAERRLNIDVDDDLTVIADRQGLAAVLNNLLSNAVKFSEAGDLISIAAGEDEEWVSLVVKNSGSRIDPEDLERIFDRFYRGGNAQRGAVAGTGIGLSVSRQIIAAHGGTLVAEDVEDGASFKACLPRD